MWHFSATSAYLDPLICLVSLACVPAIAFLVCLTSPAYLTRLTYLASPAHLLYLIPAAFLVAPASLTPIAFLLFLKYKWNFALISYPPSQDYYFLFKRRRSVISCYCDRTFGWCFLVFSIQFQINFNVQKFGYRVHNKIKKLFHL